MIFRLSKHTPKFLRGEPRHIQASVAACFYGDVCSFLMSFFDMAFCRDFLASRPDFQEVFEIVEIAGKEKMVVKESLGGFLSEPQAAAKFGDILCNFDLVVRLS